jgi:hypothetical protein
MVFLHVAADALNWCSASQADPLPLEGLRERFLPECTFRGRDNKKLQYAVPAAAALHGGTESDLLDEAAWWQTDDFWQYAMFAAVAYIRATANRAGVPARQACQDLAQRPGHSALAPDRSSHDLSTPATGSAQRGPRHRHPARPAPARVGSRSWPGQPAQAMSVVAQIKQF